MKGALVDDHLGGVDVLVVPELSRDLEGRLVGLESAVAEEDSGQTGQFAQLGCERLLQRCGVVVRAMNQFRDLLLERRHEPRMCVPEGIDCDACQAIEVLVAFGVPHPAAPAMRHRHRQATVGVHHMRFWVGDGSVGSVHEKASGITDGRRGAARGSRAGR